ncbi:MAG TPA: DUF885 domain-containing protein [Telluria sp.]
MKLHTNMRAIALILSLALGTAAHAADDLGARRAALDSLIKETWERNMRTAPEFASQIGDKRYNDKLSDFSQTAIDDDLKASKDFLQRFKAIDPTGFSPAERLNRELKISSLEEDIEGAALKMYEMPVLQNSGVHIDLPQMVSALSFDTVKDYEDYIARLHQVPRVFAENVVQMKNGIRDGLMPPQFVLPKIVRQSREIAAMKTAASPFAAPVKKFPADFSAADKKRLRAAVFKAIEKDVNPTYKKFAAFVETEYVPHGRKEPGLWSLPNGEAMYKYRVKSSTTTDLTADQVHQIGLAEVARIEGRMLETAQKLGFKDLKSFNASLDKNPALHPTSRQQMVDLYQRYTDAMYEKIPQLFGRLPQGKMKIEQVERFQEKEASGAAYNLGSADGKRPGRVMVNTGDFAKRSTIEIETTAFHEGVPGHHMQIAIGQELNDLPQFRKYAFYTAFVEGWALYSEELGTELGFFKDPYSYYGHLQSEMLRAIRLVVDTGLHSKKWSRQQVVDYFHAHSNTEEVEVQSETDRYIVWPGQALGYKIGQLKIMELREKAKAQLGDKFDIRGFHDTVLGNGALPLNVLEERVKEWVESKKAA